MTEQQPALPFDPVALAAAMTELGRRHFEAMQAAIIHFAEALRPLTEFLREHPELAEWEPEPDVPNCHHLCGRIHDHECTGEATTTLTMDNGHRVPMCQDCWVAALDARATASIEAGRLALAEAG